MKICSTITVYRDTNLAMYTALSELRRRSRAKVILRYAEIGLLYEMDVLNNTTGQAKAAKSIPNVNRNTTNEHENFDEDILEIFEITNSDETS